MVLIFHLYFFVLKDKKTLSYFEAFKATNHEITKVIMTIYIMKLYLAV